MKVVSVSRETRHYYLTCGPDPKGRGILAIISLGSPQRGDKEVTVCDMEICPSMKAARKWYKRQMKARPWNQGRVAQVISIPEGIGHVTELRAQGGKLIAETESGADFIVPLDAALIGRR
jgi:hypothetical protein